MSPDRQADIISFPASTETLSGFVAGAVIGERFRIVRFIGRGGMGDVYEVEDLAQSRRPHVALKTIRPEIASNPRMLQQFEREIEIGKTITHPNVCRVYDLGLHRHARANGAHDADSSRTMFVTMELLNGHTLAEHLRTTASMAPAEALPILKQVADGLHAAHQAHIVHRDFKPGNVMLVRGADDRGLRAVVTDFGLARDVSDGESSIAVEGTPDYMAPEQVRGRAAGPQADIYALGVVTYQMVTGRLPFEGEHGLLRMTKRLHDTPAPPRTYSPSLPETWEGAILRCLEREPERRFSTTVEFVRELEAPVATEAQRPVRTEGRTRRSRAALAAIFGAALALVFALWLLQKPLLAPFSRLPAEKRVAVLRFENIGGDAANQAFCDGLMVSLTSKLTELEQFHDTLSVVPASDVRREQVATVRDAQRDFNVNLAVTGSVQRVGDHLRLIINLVDARKLKQIRSHESSIPQADAIAMQEGVVRDIADLLQIDLRPEAVQRLAQGSTKVAAAYDSYLRGAGYLLSGKAGLDHGIAEFQRALQLDPRYALAHAGLGEAYWYKYRVTKDRQWVDKAWTECESAIALNSNAAAVHVTMALLKSGTGQYDDAIREAQKALAIDPGEYRAYTELARALDAAGRSPEAEETLKKAIALRPGYWNAHMELGTYYYRHARYDDAEAAYRRVTELVPDNPAGYTNLGVMYHLQGRDAEAERMLKESLRVRPTAFASSNLATVYFFEGHYTEAVGIYEQQISAGANDYMIWGNLADAYRWTPGLAAKAPQAYRTAAQLAQQALAVNPVDSQALSSLALYRAKLGEASAAVQNIEKALRAAPNDKNVLFKAAVVYDIAGKRTEALTYLEMAVKGGYSLNEIAAEPEMRNLRRDARYQALVGSELHRNRNHNQ